MGYPLACYGCPTKGSNTKQKGKPTLYRRHFHFHFPVLLQNIGRISVTGNF
ncbi:MAG: hypothetical protein LBE82_12950 [Chitinophagaceae bacterium]|nr:hypothetical protein [Chitinophagaceae bacterium]